jgi:Protein of unknown function (DUF3616)
MREITFVFVMLTAQLTSDCRGQLVPGPSVLFDGDVTEPTQLSAVARYKEMLVICPDEGSQFDVLEAAGDNRFRAIRAVELSNGEELDLEGAASDHEFLYVVGSHSLARKRVDPERSYEENRARLLELKAADDRDVLFRLTLGDHGKLKSKASISLRQLLRRDEPLRRFTDIPDKENGIDIEGIAVRDKQLYIGFRGPVLRGNFVPVMVLKFESADDYELRYVNLGGRGIRDIAAVSNGFLIIGGPIGDGDGSYQLYYWNGKDCIPGEGNQGGTVVLLGEIPAKSGAKAEGLAVISEDDQQCNLIVLYDGPDRGDARRFFLKKVWN